MAGISRETALAGEIPCLQGKATVNFAFSSVLSVKSAENYIEIPVSYAKNP
jgi:hypothetical protein